MAIDIRLTVFYIALFTISFIKTYAQQTFDLRFSNAYNTEINFSLKIENENIEISVFENTITHLNENNSLHTTRDLEIKNYGRNDTINKIILSKLNDVLKFENSKTVPLNNYPKIIEHLNNIYTKSKCNLCNEIDDPSTTYCGVDIFTKINGKKDLYREHREEVYESYRYFFQMIKSEFKNRIIEQNLNPILAYFDIHSLVLNREPLIVEVYNNYILSESRFIEYNFPKSDNLYLILKGESHLSKENIAFLKTTYESIHFLINKNFFKLDDLESNEDLYNLEIQPHFQHIENHFTDKSTLVQFDFENKKTLYNSFFNYKENGNYLSKEIYYTETYGGRRLYVFKNSIFGFNIGLVLDKRNQIKSIEIWDYYDYDGTQTSLNDYPDFKNSNTVYLKDVKKGGFTLKVTKDKNELKGAFSGTLYNPKTNDSIRINNGEFHINLLELKEESHK